MEMADEIIKNEPVKDISGCSVEEQGDLKRKPQT